jgi:hypothetical protein
MTFAEKIISFLNELEYKGSLPNGISVMNPFRENPEVISIVSRFYSRFYNDDNSRYLILGINPGRFGAGSTGIPFTDTKRLAEKCGLSIPGLKTYETSSAFVYEMIDAFGGTDKFYSFFYISAVSPLGFTTPGKNGKNLNYNYYDSKKLTDAVYEFIVVSLEKQLRFGINRDVCFSLGTGKNFKFIVELNNTNKYFERIVSLEHPRYIMQYKTKAKHDYINKYIKEFRKVRLIHNPGSV